MDDLDIDFEILNSTDVCLVLDTVKSFLELQSESVLNLKRDLKREKEFAVIALNRVIELENKLNQVKGELAKVELDLSYKVLENTTLKAQIKDLSTRTVGSTIGTISERDLKRLCQYLHPDRTGRDTQDLFRIFKGKLDGVRK